MAFKKQGPSMVSLLRFARLALPSLEIGNKRVLAGACKPEVYAEAFVTCKLSCFLGKFTTKRVLVDKGSSINVP